LSCRPSCGDGGGAADFFVLAPPRTTTLFTHTPPYT
jgi:hypothetical protein